MANPKTLHYRLLLLISILSFSNQQSDPDLVTDLLSLQSTSESGVIRLDDTTVFKFITSAPIPRPYSLIIFFDAVDLHSHTKLRLPEFRREFGLLSSSFISNNRNGTRNKLFFCDIESTESESTFVRFGIRALPHIYLVSPWDDDLRTESGQMGGRDFAGLAESMSKFVEKRTKLTVGPIHRPPFLSDTQIGLIITVMLISTPVIIKSVLIGIALVRDSRVWLCGAVFVYFFSVAGTMFNIIKEVPLYLIDQEREDSVPKFVFFHQGEMQLGGEGFAVGFLYTVVGLLLAVVTNVLVRVKNVNEQSLYTVLALSVSFLCVRQVVYLHTWKTGHESYPYWPSSWRS